MLPWLLPAVFLGLFFFYPLARILSLGLGQSFNLISPNFISRASHALLFTLYQASLSTIFTLLVGLPLAHLFTHFDFFYKPIFRTITAIPFMLPTIVVAAGFNAWLGPRGWLNVIPMNLLKLPGPPFQIVGSLWIIILAHVFFNTSIIIRIVGNAWSTLDTRLADAAKILGASPLTTFFKITVPLLMPAILASSLLVFLFDFTSFGVVLLLGGPKFITLEVEIYIQSLQLLNLPAASLLSILQLACTLLFSVIYSRFITGVTNTTKPRAAWNNLIKPKLPWQKMYVSILLAAIIIIFLLPMISLPIRSISRLDADRGAQSLYVPGITFKYYQDIFVNQRKSIFFIPPILAVKNSVMFAGLTVGLSLLLGFPAALALSNPGYIEKWIDPLLMLPLGASSVTLGLGYILTFNKPFLAGTTPLIISPWLIPLAHTTIALPFVIRSLQTALAQIPRRYREAAAVLGASPIKVWLHIDWPIISRAVVSAGAFAFTISLGEFGAAFLLSRPEYPTIPTAIYRFLSQPGGSNYGQAMAMATLLMLVCGLGIFLIEQLRFSGSGDF